MRQPLLVRVSPFLATAMIVGCGASPAPGEPLDDVGVPPASAARFAPSATSGPSAAPVAPEPHARQGGGTPPRYLVAGKDGVCVVIPGAGGRWVPGPLFLDAPEEVTASMCIFVWEGREGEATKADVDAFQDALPTKTVIRPLGEDGEDGEDGEARQEQDDAPLKGRKGVRPGTHAPQPVGIAGCDVCGLVRSNKAWVVLPSNMDVSRYFQVPLTSGTSQSFVIPPTANRTVSIALPPLPAGIGYVEGHVTVR